MSNLLDQEDERKLLRFHYAGHGTTKEGELHLASSLDSKSTLDFDGVFGALWSPTGDFNNADVILILDCCYSGTVTRGIKQDDKSVEIIAAAGMDQEAHGNASNLLRLQKRTFTSRLADGVAQVVGDKDKSSIAFAEIIATMRKASNLERLPEYFLRQGKIGIRLAIPNTSRIKAQGPMSLQEKQSRHTKSFSSDMAPSGPSLMAVFKIHLKQVDSTSPEVAKLVEWIHSLNPNIGFELNGVFQGHSTHILLHAPWHTWAVLNGLPGFDLICETFGGNQMQRILSKY